MEVGKAGPEGCPEVILILLLFFGAIRDACVLLAELCIAWTVSMCSDSVGALQRLPWRLIALDR